MSFPSPSVLLYKLSRTDIDCIRVMLKVQGWLKRSSKACSSSLHTAIAIFGWCDEVAELLSAGARVSEQDADGNTALHVAFLKYGEGPVVEWLMNEYLKETQRNVVNKDGLSFVHMACTSKNFEHLRKVLRYGRVDLNGKVYQRSSVQYAGYTALHFAVAFGRREQAELLLAQYQANLYEQDGNGSTPLHLALEYRNVTMMDLLLAYDKRRENVVNKLGLSHFMVACAGSDQLAVKEYLQTSPAMQIDGLIYGAVIDGNFTGYLPQHFAKAFRRFNVVQLLKAWSESNVDSSREDECEGSLSDWDSTESLNVPGKSNKLVGCVCVGFEIITFAMFLLMVVPGLFCESLGC